MGDSRDVAVDSRERRVRYGARLRREREALGLTQRLVADRAEVPQASVSRAEAGHDVGEDVLAALEALYRVRDPYPAAPLDPVRREEWFAGRNSGLRPAPPASGIFGKGDPPKVAA